METHQDAAPPANPVAFSAGGMSIPGLDTGNDTQQVKKDEQTSHQGIQKDAATPKTEESAQSSITLGAQDGSPTRDAGPDGGELPVSEQAAEDETTPAFDAKPLEFQAPQTTQDVAPGRRKIDESLHTQEEAMDDAEPESLDTKMTTSSAPGLSEGAPLRADEKLAANVSAQEESNEEEPAKINEDKSSAQQPQDVQMANDDGPLQLVQMNHETANTDVSDQVSTNGLKAVKSDVEPSTTSSTLSNGINQPADATQVFQEVSKVHEAAGEAEFETDSEPYESSDSDSIGTTSSSDDSDEDGFQTLGLEEAALRLMEDGGSDDEGGGRAANLSGSIRTANEKADKCVPKPDIVVTVDDKIVLLGKVKNIVENSILIEAETKWDYQVLEHGSVLCLEDRTVIGAVGETLGRVQQPYYSVLFSNAQSISESGINIDTSIYYLEKHSKYTFTQTMKALKGSDASNIHDEEVARDEMEFSDDEAEAECRRAAKMQRQSRNEGRAAPSEGFSRGPRGSRGRGRGPRQWGGHFNHSNGIPATPENASSSTSPTLNYDDGSESTPNGLSNGDELYTPLIRPANLHEIVPEREAPTETSPNGSFGPAGYSSGGRGRSHQDAPRAGSRGPGSFRPTSNSTNIHAPPQPPSHNQGYGVATPPAYDRREWNSQDSLQMSPVPFYSPIGSNINPSLHPQRSPQYGQQNPSSHSGYSADAGYVGYRDPSQAFQPANHLGGQVQFRSQASPIHGQQQNLSHFQQPQSQPPNFPSIPAGAHVNPAFFSQQQGSPQPRSWPNQGPHTNGYSHRERDHTTSHSLPNLALALVILQRPPSSPQHNNPPPPPPPPPPQANPPTISAAAQYFTHRPTRALPLSPPPPSSPPLTFYDSPDMSWAGADAASGSGGGGAQPTTTTTTTAGAKQKGRRFVDDEGEGEEGVGG